MEVMLTKEVDHAFAQRIYGPAGCTGEKEEKEGVLRERSGWAVSICFFLGVRRGILG